MSGAEAAAAFGLAAGIMQVIGFSLQLWDTAEYIRKTGSTITTADCTREADVLLKQCEEVKLLQAADKSQLDESVRINEIADESCLIIQDVAKSLIRCKVPEGAKGFTRFKDILVNVLWNGRRTDVDELRKTLERLRNELQFQLVISIKQKVDTHDVQRTVEYEKLGSSLKNLVNALLEGDASVRTQLQQMRQQQDEISRGVQDILDTKKHRRFVVRDEVTVLEELKNRLWFNAMPHRHNAIDEAYKCTFEWAFLGKRTITASNLTFVDWMRSDEGFYWVSGRAGTGKSSFMRFLNDDGRTAAAFQKWAGDRPLIIGSFYFWNDPDHATDPRLHRLEGIYQGLLYQILQAAPKLARVLFPDQIAGRDWGSFPTLSDSKEAFLRLLKADTLPVAIAMIVDGLDEYDAPHGEQIALARLLRDAAKKPHFKILVSSRPEFSFEVAFEGCARLELDRLTEGDRRIYVTDSLFKNARFGSLGATLVEQQALIDQVVERSEGIFLWVRIVVMALEEELYMARNIQSLVTLVDTTPGGDKTLAELFGHILRNRIRPEFRFRGFQMIWVLQQCLELTSPLLSRMSTEVDHRDLATGTLYSLLQDDIATFDALPMADTQRENRQRQTAFEMQRYCAGLIEMRPRHGIPDQEVHFLHKDVSIFLNQPGQMDLLRQTLGLVEPNLLVLLEAFVMMVMGHRRVDNSDEEMPLQIHYYPYQLAEVSLRLGRLTEDSDITRTTYALDKLDASMSRYYSSYSHANYGTQEGDENQPHWANSFPYIRLRMPCFYPAPNLLQGLGFLNLAIQNGLCKYVQVKLRKEPGHLTRKGLPLLSSACAPIPQWCFLKPHPLQARTVEMLLNHGCDPNELFLGYSHWQMALFIARDSIELDSNGLEELAKIIGLLLRHGADPQAKIGWSGVETSPDGSQRKKYYERSAEEQVEISFIDRFADTPIDETILNGSDTFNYKHSMNAEAKYREKFLNIGNELLMLCRQDREGQGTAMPAVVVGSPEPVPEASSTVAVPVTHPPLENSDPTRTERSGQSKSMLKRMRESWKAIRRRKDQVSQQQYG